LETRRSQERGGKKHQKAHKATNFPKGVEGLRNKRVKEEARGIGDESREGCDLWQVKIPGGRGKNRGVSPNIMTEGVGSSGTIMSAITEGG